MDNTTKQSVNIILLLIVVLLAGNILLGVNYFLSNLELMRYLQNSQKNEKVVDLSTLFVQKVLKTQGEVALDDRLKLENAISDANDPQITKAWQNFLASKSEQDARNGALDLLNIFFNKIAY